MPKEANNFQLIRTKLNRPRQAGALVARPRLLKQLDRQGERPLTLVVAPAGYGKTTLVSTWLERLDGPSAWLSLDEHDSDLNVFLTYFLAAIQTMFPDACPKISALLKAAALPPLPVIAGSLVNELNDIDQPFILVLDDYHAIHEPAVHELLAELLRYPPKEMHLVLISRRNPLLPLTRLRARGFMTEIRTQDLRFTTAEAASLLEQLIETEVNEAVVSLLEKKTEGWVTGLRLAVLSIRHRGDLDNLLADLKGTSRYVTDYLVSEVLAQQPPEIQEFLLKSSILDRLCDPLCEAVVGPAAGRAYLETVARADLFIASLDDQRQWFRYQYLFQQFLLHRLQQQYSLDEIAVLHARAAAWFGQNGMIEEALRHALAAGDTSSAVQLIAQHRHAVMNQDQWSRLGRWLRLFPAEVIETEPDLLISEAWVKQIHSQLVDLPRILERLEYLLAQSSLEENAKCHLRGEMDTIRAIMHFYTAEAKPALALLDRSLTILPRDYYHVRSLASIMMGYAYQMTGDLNAATTLASKGLLEMPKNEMFQIRLLIMLSIVYWMEADLENMWLAAARCLEAVQNVDSVLGLSGGQYFQGCVHYQRNELAAAERAFSAVVDRPYLSYGHTFAHASFGLASVYQAQGRLDQARQVVDSAVAFIIETDNIFLIPAARAFQAELAARQDRLAEAGQWASQAGATQRREAMTGFYGPQLALPKVLLAQNTVESRQQAADYLAQLHSFVGSIHNTRFLIEVLALEALLYQAQGNRSAALEALTQAITLAQPGGFIRLFVDLGPQIEPLLAELAQDGVLAAHIVQIRAAFGRTRPQGYYASTKDASQPVERKPHPELIETFTNREMDVLLLMAERLTNKEIAQNLGISSETVKQHTINLYRKLHVNNRRQAVTQARTLGVLPPD